jgi:tetratricopeptide (TPR) repeat protein
LGRYDDALRLFEEAFSLSKEKLGADHPNTLLSDMGVIDSLVRLKRPEEALPRIASLLRLADQATASGKRFHPGFVPRLFACQLGIYHDAMDPAGCRGTAEQFEARGLTNAGDMYNAAKFWIVTARLQAKVSGEDAAKLAEEDANRAMDRLAKAVAAGFNSRAHIDKDADLDYLREREDFKRLLGSLPAE